MRAVLRNLSNASTAVSIMKKLWGGYYCIKQWWNERCKDSQTYKLVKGLEAGIRICFKYSFLGRISEIREKEAMAVLDNSRVIHYLANSFKRWQDKINYYPTGSLAVELTKNIKKELPSYPLKIISIIIIAAIVTNIVLITIFHKAMDLWYWLVLGTIFFVGIGGLFCNAVWLNVKSNSIILKKIKKE